MWLDAQGVRFLARLEGSRPLARGKTSQWPVQTTSSETPASGATSRPAALSSSASRVDRDR